MDSLADEVRETNEGPERALLSEDNEEPAMDGVDLLDGKDQQSVQDSEDSKSIIHTTEKSSGDNDSINATTP